MLSPIEIIKKRQPRIIKIRLQRYFTNHGEPRDNPLRDSPMSGEKVLTEDSQIMRRRFRSIANKIRVIRVRYK